MVGLSPAEQVQRARVLRQRHAGDVLLVLPVLLPSGHSVSQQGPRPKERLRAAVQGAGLPRLLPARRS